MDFRKLRSTVLGSSVMLVWSSIGIMTALAHEARAASNEIKSTHAATGCSGEADAGEVRSPIPPRSMYHPAPATTQSTFVGISVRLCPAAAHIWFVPV
jgi:hypothetical protein